MKYIHLYLALMVIIAIASCKKKNDTTQPSTTRNNTSPYSISVYGTHMFGTSITLVANGTKGHKVHWMLGDGGEADGDSVVHVYETPDSFYVSISLDDQVYVNAANIRIGIKSGIEDHLGTFHWQAFYHFDSNYVAKDWSSEKDITLSSPAAGVVRISADDDTVMGWFNHPVDVRYVFKDDTMILFSGPDITTREKIVPDIVYWNFKNNAIWFSRSQSLGVHGYKFDYLKYANYFRK